MSTVTSLPPWAADPGSLTLTEAQYDALPERVRKLVEVIDGNVTFCPGGTPEHAGVTRTLAVRLDAARPAQLCTRVFTSAAVHFAKRSRSDGTLSFRRPDISVSRCTGKDARLFAQDALMLVEVVTPAGLTGPAGPTSWPKHMDELTLKDPFPVRVPFGQLRG
jgi:hypothetical protein